MEKNMEIIVSLKNRQQEWYPNYSDEDATKIMNWYRLYLGPEFLIKIKRVICANIQHNNVFLFTYNTGKEDEIRFFINNWNNIVNNNSPCNPHMLININNNNWYVTCKIIE